MARLPQPGGDRGTWGDILNDFLSQAHNADGTIKSMPRNAADIGAEPTGLSTATQGMLSAAYLPVLTPEKYGAIGDGSADDTAAVQSALAAAGNGQNVYLRGTYKVTSQLSLSNKTGVVVYGPGTISYSATNTDTHGVTAALAISGCDRVRVESLNFTCITQGQSYNGIAISTSTHVQIVRCKVYNFRWVGIAVYDTVPGMSKSITLDNNVIELNRFGVTFNGKWVRITNNLIADYWLSSGEATVAWASSSKYYDGIIISDGADEYTVSGNTIIEVGQSGIYASQLGRGLIANNVVVRPQNWGMDFGPATTAENITLTGNTVIDAAVGSINLYKINNSTITGNTLINTGATYFGAVIAKVHIAFNSTSSFNVATGNSCLTPTGVSVAAIFTEATGHAAVGNVIRSNQVTADVPYSVNTVDNPDTDVPRTRKAATRFVGGNIVVSNTTWAALSPTLDLTVQAAVGDWVEFSVLGQWGATGPWALLDAATMVSGGIVHYLSTGTSTAASAGIVAWRGVNDTVVAFGGTAQYQVQAGDLDASGNLTIRLFVNLLYAGSRTLYSNSNEPFLCSLRNSGA